MRYAYPKSSAATAAVLAVALSAVVGCQDGHYGSKDDPHDASVKVPSIDKTYEMVAIGKPPLTFWVSSGGWIKVIDATDNTMIHTAQIPPTNGGLVIRIDPQFKAITYALPDKGSDKPEKGSIVQPIDPDHRFELYYQK